MNTKKLFTHASKFVLLLCVSVCLISCNKEVVYTHWRVASGLYTLTHEYPTQDGSFTETFTNVMLVKNIGEDKQQNPPWVIREHLDGFDFEPGYEYILLVRHIYGKPEPNVADDWGLRGTTILGVVSKEKKETFIDPDDIDYYEFTRMGHAL